jgi:ribosomal-protein-alanine N-acetyltransferase
VLFPLTKINISQYIDAMIEMSAQLKDDYWTAEHYLTELPKKWKLSFVVIKNERLAGFMIVSDKGEAHHLHRIVVSKSFQKKGIGKTLLSKLKEDAIRDCKKELTLKVHSTNTEAIKLYEKIGFVKSGKSDQNYSYKLVL